MILYFLKTAVRSLAKDKLHSVISILGFALAMTLVVLIALNIHYELSTDQYHQGADQIFRIGTNNTPTAVAPYVAQHIPEIASVCRIISRGGTREVFVNNKKYKVPNIILSEDSFFDVFAYAIKLGPNREILKEGGSIVLTESLANKIFGDTNPIGKVIENSSIDPFVVTAVIQDPPLNSSLKFEAILSFAQSERAIEIFGKKSINDDWKASNFKTFAKLIPTAKKQDVSEKIQRTLASINQSEVNLETLELYSLRDNYFNPDLHTGFRKGDAKNLFILSSIAFLILMLAITNFFNLATSKAITRGAEIGIRKVNGASRKIVAMHFLSEALLISSASMILAVLFVNYLIPGFNNMQNIRLDHIYFQSSIHWIIVLGGILILTLVAGSFPAFYLSSFNPALVLKSTSLKSKGVNIFRKSLVVFQFAITIILLIGTMVVSKQLKFLNNKDLGYDKESILTINSTLSLHQTHQVFLKSLINHPAIVSFSTTSDFIGEMAPGKTLIHIKYQGQDTKIACQSIFCDSAFFKTFDVQILAEQKLEGEKEYYVYLNETAIKQLAADDPLALETFNSYRSSDGGERIKGFEKISGVVKDFNFGSLRNEVTPAMLRVYPNTGIVASIINIRFNPMSFNSTAEMIAFCEEKYNELDPDEPLEYQFLDDRLALLYSQESRFLKVFTIFSVLAILISCLGLFGLIYFANSQRTKEIGIRKAMGATVQSVLFLLIKNYLKWVVFAFVIATPIGIFLTKRWLENFAYKTTLSWWIFALAGALALGIALVTVSCQSWRAATRNPIESLRYE